MTRRASWRSVVLVALLVGASLAGSVGTVSAQQGEYQHEFTSGDAVYVVDFGTYEGQIDVRFASPSVPGDKSTVWAGTLSTNQIDNNRIRLVNAQAYDDLTVTITGPTESPSYESSGPQVLPQGYTLGSTGGDANMKCGRAEKLSQTTTGTDVVDCTGYPGIASINTSGTDAAQIRASIAQKMISSRAAYQSEAVSIRNRVEDSRTIAQLEGKNAYVRAMVNGSTKAEARAAAVTASEEYYAGLEKDWIDNIERMHLDWWYWEQQSRTEGLDNDFISLFTVDNNYIASESETTLMNTTATLSDGSTRRFSSIGFVDGSAEPVANIPRADLSDDTRSRYELQVQTTDSTSRTRLEDDQATTTWDEIQVAEESTENELETFVNKSYNDYEDGNISITDVMDPYLLSREYSPGDNYQGWAAAQLTLLGVNSPENYEQLGSFEVSSGSENYTGILFSDENPASGRFEAGTTYDPAEINGSQFIVTANETHELESQFTLNKITTSNNETVQNATIRNPQYNESSIDGLRQQYQNLSVQLAKIEAREDALRANSGIPDSDGGGTDNRQLLYIGAGAAVVLIIIGELR